MLRRSVGQEEEKREKKKQKSTDLIITLRL